MLFVQLKMNSQIFLGYPKTSNPMLRSMLDKFRNFNGTPVHSDWTARVEVTTLRRVLWAGDLSF
jgi:hypothetical protein